MLSILSSKAIIAYQGALVNNNSDDWLKEVMRQFPQLSVTVLGIII
jgi:hypothetical protein